jgi:hypothetical protein
MNETKKIIRKHITRVNYYLLEIQKRLFERGQDHDKSKLDKEELPLFEKYAPLLKTCKYGSEEYKQFLSELKPALNHHYAKNRHHPEFFKRWNCNGCHKNYYGTRPNRCDVCGYSQMQEESDISQMNLVDLCEMFCDWIAAGEQHSDGGDIFKSIEINQERFGYSDDIKSILINTANIFKKKK